MNEQPGEADGDEHGEEDESKHEAPGGTGVGGPGCLWRVIFVGIGHCLVYGDWLLPREVATERGTRECRNTGHWRQQGSNTNLGKRCLKGQE